VETAARSPGAGLEGQQSLLLAPEALPTTTLESLLAQHHQKIFAVGEEHAERV
jgi:hypothetical protein